MTLPESFFLRVHFNEHVLMYSQIFQASPVLQLQVRGSNSKSSQHSSVEELTVVYAKSLVRVDASDLQVHYFNKFTT